MFLVVGLVQVTVWALVETAVFLPVSQLIAVGTECSSAVFFGDRFEVFEEGQGVDLMKAFDDIGLEGFPLFFVWVLVLICDEISVCAVEGEHQTMKFTMGGDRDLKVGVSE